MSISGWVDVRRDQGRLVFLISATGRGKMQGVVLPCEPGDGGGEEYQE